MSALLGLPGGREEPAGRSLVGLASSDDTVDMPGHVFNHCAVLTRPLEDVGAGCWTIHYHESYEFPLDFDDFHWILMIFIDF